MKGKKYIKIKVLLGALLLSIFGSCFGAFQGAKGETGALTAKAAGYRFAETIDYSQLRLRGAPTIVADIVNARNLYFVSSDNEGMSAVNAFFHVDEDENIVDANGRSIESLAEALSETDKRVIPDFSIETEGALSALEAYCEKNAALSDAAVVSSDAALLKKAREALPVFRAILDCTKEETFDGGALARTANEAGALVILLPQRLATKENVGYLQARMKTVWVKLDGKDTFDIYAGIASGAFGLVTEGDPKDVSAVYERFESIKGITLPRAPLNVAHRGDPYRYNENSLEGFLAAAEGGATHIEADAHLTSDKKIVIMHDASIDRTTNGTGTIANMTYDELRQYKIVKNMAGQPTQTQSVIPDIDELFTALADKDVLIFFEIKTNHSGFAAIFREKIEEYGMQDRIVAISFDRAQISYIREQIPYLWTLDLNDKKETVGETVTDLCARNTGTDMSAGNAGIMRDMLDRGYLPAAWTYGTATDVKTAARSGVYGITNNDASACGSYPARLVVPELPEMKKSEIFSEGFTLRAQIEKLNGTTEETDCVVLAARDCGEYAELIPLALNDDWNLIGDVVRVGYSAEESDAPLPGKGCGSVQSGTAAAALLSAAALLFVRLRKTPRAICSEEKSKGEK